jgi:protein-L-isoaspartate(D-aspartate) O-methyltransferase
MVAEQIRARGVRDPALLAAMESVPRERFVPEELRDRAFADGPLPIGAGQTISQPYVVAAMIELLGLGRGDRVLEVGTGSGYAAAVLARVVAEVYTVERFASLASQADERLASLGFANVHVRHGDGSLGWPEHAPYQGILVSAGAAEIPPALREQLAAGGRLVIPVGPSPGYQTLTRVTRQADDDFREEAFELVAFVPLLPSTA